MHDELFNGRHLWVLTVGYMEPGVSGQTYLEKA